MVSRNWAGRSIVAATVVCFAFSLAAQQTTASSSGSNYKGRVCNNCEHQTLWPKVVARCVPGMFHRDGVCTRYDLKNGYVITKDIASEKPVAYLIIPIDQITGVEDEKIFQPPQLNLWKYALDESVQYPGPHSGQTIGMAINAKCKRTDGQLHIHISCVRESVLKKLKDIDSQIGYDPAVPYKNAAYEGIAGEYRVVKVKGLTEENSPFVVISKFPGARGDMVDQGIAVVPAPREGEYYVLNTTYNDDASGGAEEILEQSCTGK